MLPALCAILMQSVHILAPVAGLVLALFTCVMVLLTQRQRSTASTPSPRQPPFDLDAAHRHCRNNRAELAASRSCGCFHCLSLYPAKEITEWVDEDQTAICAKCPVDAVLAEAAGYPLTQPFLQQMQDRWFT